MLYGVLAARACCDDSPQPEVMAQSPNKKYAAVITPRYYIRSIDNTPFEFYQDSIILTFAEQMYGEGSYKTIWQMNIDDKGNDYDYMDLLVTNSGYILVIADSYSSFTDNEIFRVFNLKGERIMSYKKSMILMDINSPQEFNTRNLHVESLENMFIFHYSNKFLLTIDCEKRNIIPAS